MANRILFLFTIILKSFITFSQTDIANNEPAQVILSGRITDAKTGEPLSGATVYLADMKTGTSADASGQYILRNLPAGHHLIEVSHTGYNTMVEHFDLDKDMEKNFMLTISVAENQGVVVTGVSSATSIRKAPIPVSVVKKAELQQTISSNIIDAISRKPGVSQLTTGPGISKPFIRGLGYNRVVVINDGVRQEGQQWGDEHGIEIDELSVNKVEVLKGPASLMYGSDALAGVINIVTHVPVQEGTVKGNIFSAYQTNNRQRGLHGNIAGNLNGLNWNLYSSLKSAGDYTNEFDGRVLNSRFKEGNFGGYLGVNKGWGYSHLIFSGFNQRPGLIEGDRDDATGKFILFAGSPLERIATSKDLDSRELFTPNQKIRHYKIASDNNIAIRKSRLKLNIGYQNNLRQEFGNPEDPEEEELFFDLKTINYNAQLVLAEMGKWHTSIGVNGMYQTSENKGEEVLIPEYDLFDFGTSVFAQGFYNKITVSGGVRFDKRFLDSKEFFEGSEQKFSSFKKNFFNFSASAGVSFEPTDNLTMKMNIARGFRAPNIAELGSNGVHEGTFRYEYGEVNLKPESGLQFDAGIELEYEHFSFSMSAFYNHINNFIYYRKLQSVFGSDSLVNVDGEDIPAYRFDQKDAELSGMEFNLDVHPHPLDWLHIENTISFVRGRLGMKVDGTNNLPLMPPTRWISELRGNFLKAGKTFCNLYIKFEIDKTFDQTKPFFAYNTETPTPGYALMNAGIGTDIAHKGQTLLSIHFGAINIANETYQNHLSRLKYAPENMATGRPGIYNMGRNFSFKINIPLWFSKKQ